MFQLSPTDSGGDVLHLFFLSLILSSVSPPGQGAITRLCLQRTPDQTVTASGSRRAPRAFDSTDRQGLCSWEKRDPTPSRTGSSASLKLSSISVFFFLLLFFSTQQSRTAPQSSKELEGEVCEREMRSLLLPPRVCWHCDHGRLLLSLWWSL